MLQKGLKKFGQHGKDSAMLEMKQLNDCTCFQPIRIEDMSLEEKKRAVESLIFLTEKKDERIKSRTCINGSKQRI